MESPLSQIKCPAHHSDLFYYCATCSVKLCQDCAVFTHSSTSHQVTRITSSHKLDLKQVISSYATLGKSLNSLSFLVVSISKKLEKIKENYRNERKSLEIVHESMQKALEDLLDERLKRLEMKKTLILNEKLILEKILKTIQAEIDLSSQVQMISNSELLLEKIKEITSVPWTEEVLIEKPEKFKNPVLPQYKTATFEIQRFLDHDDCLNSQVLEAYLSQWQLKVYPKGNGTSQGEYVSVFLQLVAGVHEDQSFEFRIQLKNANPELSVVKEGKLKFKVAECWGFSRFFMIDQLDSGFIQKDSVFFDFSVRPANYLQITRDQLGVISKLKDSQMKLIIN